MFTRQIAEGLCHLHKANPPYIDLKQQTVLLHEDETGELIVKLNGFSHYEETFSNDYAPEVRRGSPETTMSDIYALGVIMYRIVEGCHCWESLQTSGSSQIAKPKTKLGCMMLRLIK